MFQTEFHLVVGMLMALAYAYAIEPVLKGGPWAKGLLYAPRALAVERCVGAAYDR